MAEGRFKHAAMLWKNGPLGRWLAAAWFIYGIVAPFRDEFLGPAGEERFRGANLMHHALSIPLPWWIVVAACVTAIWTFEASYRLAHQYAGNIASLQGKIAALTPPSDLDLEYRADAETGIYEDEVVRMPLVWVKNSRGKFQDHCQLQMAISHDGWDNPLRYSAVSALFALKIDEEMQLPIGMYGFDKGNGDFRIKQYNKIADTWQVHPYPQEIPPGEYGLHIKVISSNSKSKEIELQLSHDGRTWKLKNA